LRIQRFASSQFRNLEHEPIVFAPGLNLLIGDNGHGKTNMLEAVSLFKFGRSFRTPRDNDMVCFGQEFCRVEVQSEYSSGETNTLAVSIERSGTKRIKIDGDELPKLSDLVGRYPCVLFGPHDLDVVSGFPAERRKFLDMTGSMTDRVYLDTLRSYRRVLAQRNAALKAQTPQRARSVWDDELVKQGCALVQQRTELVNRIRKHLMPHVEALAVAYAIEIEYESELLEAHADNIACEEHYVARLAALDTEEARRRTTLVGPHRDDIKLTAGGRDLRRYGSQGQRRLVAVLLRLAELSFLESKLGEPCVLLLDDLFSELDDVVSRKLKKLLDGRRQIFVTSPVEIGWEGADAAKTFHVSNGKVSA
jgi:DNA replication and repair protein RecF